MLPKRSRRTDWESRKVTDDGRSAKGEKGTSRSGKSEPSERREEKGLCLHTPKDRIEHSCRWVRIENAKEKKGLTRDAD